MPTTSPTTITALDQPLLRPVDLAGLRLPNRVVVAPTTRARAENSGLAPTDLHVAHYARRATAGLIVTESTLVSERATGQVNVPGIYSEEQVAGWRRVTDVVHALGGRIVMQLWHAGAVSHPDHHDGRLPGGPSAVNPEQTVFTPTGPKATVTPHEMSLAEIAQAVLDYATAAANARRAGFDGVELPAHGVYLLPQFLSPRLNRRTDAYGGDRFRRRRFLFEVLDAVTAVWDGAPRVGVRLAPYWNSGGPYAFDVELLPEYDELTAELGDRRIAYLHLLGPDLPGPHPTAAGSTAPGSTALGSATAGSTADRAAPDLSRLARYRRLFAGPLIANNGFDRESANAAVASGVADAVSFARHFIANPDLVTRFALGREPAPGDPSTYYAGGVRGYLD
ncbi:oxidoreductase [Streptacidiphilus anmyonensis]|uniref:oxidoreductase n=1 Tax=Streptacidiphilus anmyonensis TaxID=405782 RepID=UPI0005A8CE98|nr:12-oxophytodienoate reductase [Streptacidiphilus anmyonensis]